MSEITTQPTKRTKLSVSAIQTYQKCPKKYWFNYIDKPPVPRVPWVHLELGSCIHLALEKFHGFLMKQPLPQTEWAGLMKKCLEAAIKEFNQEMLETQTDDIKKIVQDYLNELKATGLPNVLAVEQAFEINIGDYFMKGFIDRVDLVSPGVYRVVDYKTSKDPKYLDKFQLQVYAMVLRDQHPDLEKVTGSYLLLKHGSKLKSWEFTDGDLDDARSDIIKNGDLITRETTWVKKPTKLCDFCDYKELCLGSWCSDEGDAE